MPCKTILRNSPAATRPERPGSSRSRHPPRDPCAATVMVEPDPSRVIASDPMSEDILEQIRAAQAAVERADDHATAARARRNQLIRQAVDSGITRYRVKVTLGMSDAAIVAMLKHTD